MDGDFGGKRGVVDRSCAPDEGCAVLGERGRVRESGRGARGIIQYIGAVVLWSVR